MDFRNTQRQTSSEEEESSSDSRGMEAVNTSAKKKKGPILISFDEKLRNLISMYLKNSKDVSQLSEYLVNLFCNILKINCFDDVQCQDFIFTEKIILSSLNNLLFRTKKGMVVNNGPIPAIANKPEEHVNYYYENQFKQGKLIGSGGQGEVYEAEHLVDKTYYAIKKIAIKCSSTNLNLSLKEVTTLAQLDHVNIVKYKHSWIQPMSESDYQSQRYFSDHETSDESENSKKSSTATTISEARVILYIQMSLCKESLRTWMDGRNDYSSVEIINLIVTQILNALEYIHKQNIIHHDVNPSNIFIKSNSEELQVQLGDFGLACSSPKDKHNEGMGTHPYAAPEQLKGNCYIMSDIYSFGIVLLELLKPMKTTQEFIEVLQSFKKQRKVPKDIMHKYKKWVPFLKMCTDPYPRKRPTASTLLDYLKSKTNSADIKALKKVNYAIRNVNNRLTMENKQKGREINMLKFENMRKDNTIATLKEQNEEKDLHIAQLIAQLRARAAVINVRVYEDFGRDIGGIFFG